MRERGGLRLEDAAQQERQHLRGERAPGAGAHVVEALDDERRLLGDRALQLGTDPVVARGVDLRPQGDALGGIWLVHDGGVPVLEGAMLRVLDAGVPVVAQLVRVVCVLSGVGATWWCDPSVVAMVYTWDVRQIVINLHYVVGYIPVIYRVFTIRL